MKIVPIYAALMAFGFLFLTYRVITIRRSLKVAIGTKGDQLLERVARVHANFVEYAPFGLLLLVLLEMKGANAIWLHALCLALLTGRAVHAYGVSQQDEDFRLRVFGMMSTLTVIAATALSLLWLSL
jgi:uncharacterized membrane protein YecN with MAPEG domain